MAIEVSCRAGFSLTLVIGSNMSQSKNTSSSISSNSLGVLQCSVLGQVLFLLYINDSYRSSNMMRVAHFVDDATVFASDRDINNVHATLNRELVGVDNWLKANNPFSTLVKLYI